MVDGAGDDADDVDAKHVAIKKQKCAAKETEKEAGSGNGEKEKGAEEEEVATGGGGGADCGAKKARPSKRSVANK